MCTGVPVCLVGKKATVERLLQCVFGECATGARSALTLSVGLDSLNTQISLMKGVRSPMCVFFGCVPACIA